MNILRIFDLFRLRSASGERELELRVTLDDDECFVVLSSGILQAAAQSDDDGCLEVTNGES